MKVLWAVLCAIFCLAGCDLFDLEEVPIQPRDESGRLAPDEPGLLNRFGTAVAVSQQMLAVGTPGFDIPVQEGEAALTGAGAVLIFQRSGNGCLLYTSPSPRDRTRSRMPSSA